MRASITRNRQKLSAYTCQTTHCCEDTRSCGLSALSLPKVQGSTPGEVAVCAETNIGGPVHGLQNHGSLAGKWFDSTLAAPFLVSQTSNFCRRKCNTMTIKCIHRNLTSAVHYSVQLNARVFRSFIEPPEKWNMHCFICALERNCRTDWILQSYFLHLTFHARSELSQLNCKKTWL